MQDFFIESVKLQRIGFFMKLVASSQCSSDEKDLAIAWMSELTGELVSCLAEPEAATYTVNRKAEEIENGFNSSLRD